MRKLFIIGVGLVMTLFMAGSAIAQEKAKTEGSAEAVKVAEPAKPIEYRMGGIITAIDLAAKKITLTQRQVERERTVTLALGKEVRSQMADLKAGEAVDVWVRGKIITRLNEVES